MEATRTLTAAQVILLAGDDLAKAGSLEFTEWDLTLAAWDRDRKRFGMRGYELTHPDHKRVSGEIMGDKPSNPVQLGFMEKIRPNTYRMTPLGRAAAIRLRNGEPLPSREKDPYKMLLPYVTSTAFASWKKDPEQPKTWAIVAGFLSEHPDTFDDVASQLTHLQKAIEAGTIYCRDNAVFRLDFPRNGTPIFLTDIADLNDFLHMLRYRFPNQMGA